MRGLGRIVVGLAVLYVVSAASLVAMRHVLIYPFLEGRNTLEGLPGAQEVRVPGTPERVFWWVPPAKGQPVIAYFPGNAGLMSMGETRLAPFVARGYGVAALAYRGSPGAPGRPSEAALVADARAMLAALPAQMGQVPDVLILWGTSLGAGVAAATAAHVHADALVLEAGFSRLCAAARDAYPVFPACWILWDERYPTEDLLPTLDAAVLIAHGAQDRVIPLHHARRNAAARPDARLIVYPEGGHGDLRAHGLVEDVARFLEQRPKNLQNNL